MSEQTWRKLALDMARLVLHYLKKKDYADRYKMMQMAGDILAKEADEKNQQQIDLSGD